MKLLNAHHTAHITDMCKSRYKKLLGAWGESQLDTWMHTHGWSIDRKNLKMRHGEIDRIYKIKKSTISTLYCISEIKTVSCQTQNKFALLFTDIGLFSLLKRHQISNLYKFAENLTAVSGKNHVHIRFFIVLKMYQNYEKEIFFQKQNTYKICLQTKNILILSLTPDYIR